MKFLLPQFSKSIITFLFGLFLSASLMAFSGGDGSQEFPFEIATANDVLIFQGFAANDASYYVLIADIDMAGIPYVTPANVFKGFIDGRGYVISNLTITAEGDFAGLIGQSTSGEIKNLGLENVSITSGKFAGGLVGRVNSTSPGTKISGCFVTGIIDTNTGSSTAGGLVGKYNNTANTKMENCYSSASLKSKSNTGGLVGYSSKNTTYPINSVFYGKLEGTAPNRGPIGGRFFKNTDFSGQNLYYDADCGEIKGSYNYVENATAIATADLSDQSKYAGLDFDNIWVMRDDRAELAIFGEKPVATDTSSITYANMGDVDNSKNPTTYTDLDEVKLREPVGDSLNYIFEGWYSDMALTLPVSIPAIEAGTIADTTFYAKWVLKAEFDITYMNVDSTEHDNPLTYSNSMEIKLSAPTVDSTGYYFGGWFTDAALTVSAPNPAIAVGAVGEKTFYASWVAIVTSNIAYENLGDVTHDNPITYTNSEAVRLNKPTSDSTDYTWGGWYRDADLTVAVGNPALAKGSVGDTTFYGKWIAPPFTGKGTMEEPYLVSDAAGVQGMSAFGNRYFKLTTDIDMDSLSYTTIASLTGGIDGDNHVIKNLTIKGAGLVNKLEGDGYIKNLGLVYLTLKGTSTQGVGGFVGVMFDTDGKDNRTLENCYIQGGSISSTSAASVGGLVGWCWPNAGNVIRNCFVDATITGGDEVGGLTGRTLLDDDAVFEKCAFYGRVSHTDKNGEHGAIRGNIKESPEMPLDSTLYYYAMIKSDVSQGNATVVADLLDANNFPDLDFDNIWKMGDNYPTLKYTVDVIVNGINKKQAKVNIANVYPNPSDGLMTVELKENAKLMVYNLNGAAVYQQNAQVGNNVLNLSVLQSGLYLLTVSGETSSQTVKIQIK